MGYNWEEIPEKYKPHWSTWKIEGTRLEDVQKRLNAQGLHNPWLRNIVWRYKMVHRHTNLTKVFKRGLVPGFAIFLGALAIETFAFPKKGDGHH